jgi:small subunit ribosomal protein S1
LEFKVIEFSKDNKKIILSHSKIFQDEQRATKAKEHAKAKTVEKTTKKAVRKIKANLEKTTLGDIEALASLKSNMEQKEKKEKAKPKTKAD